MSDTADKPKVNVLLLLFSYQGTIGRGQYALLLLICAGCLAAAFFGALAAANPKGSDAGLLLTFPLLITFIMIFPAAVVKRLRDAGWSGKAKALFALLPVVWILLTILFANFFAVLIPLGAAALVLIPLMAGPLPNEPKPEA
jgi:uncharacterized membrane protein YhaH (DUF805 family)